MMGADRMRPGDPCDRCGAKLQVLNTMIRHNSRVRYLGCRRCGYRPPGNKIAVALCNNVIAISSNNRVENNHLCGRMPAGNNLDSGADEMTSTIGLAELAEKLGVSRDTLRRAWLTGRFPAPVRISQRKLVWPISKINAFLDQAADDPSDHAKSNDTKHE